MCFSGKYTKDDIYDIVTKKRGLTSLLGTNDIKKIVKRIEDGDEEAKLVLDAMIYQIAKQIGSYSVNFRGNIDAIILTGAIANSEYFTSILKGYIEFLGKVIIIPGEKEMEALSNGVLRTIRGEEVVLEYTGEPIGMYTNVLNDE